MKKLTPTIRTLLPGLVWLAGVMAMLVLSLANEYQDSDRHAQVEVENISRLLEEHALAIVRESDLLMRDAQQHVRPDDMRMARGTNNTRARELHAMLEAHNKTVPELMSALHLTSAKGEHIYSSLSALPHINISDRYHFQRQRDDPDAGLVISPPLVSRTTGKWTLILTRRINFEDGSFAGILNAILDPEYFQKFYRSIDLGKHGAISLYDKELHLVTRYPQNEKDIGNIIPHSYAKTCIEKGIKQAIYHAKSPVDNTDRMYSFRQVGDLPLFIIAGIAAEDYLAGTWRHAWEYGIGLFALSLIVAGFGLRQRRAEKALLKSDANMRAILDSSPYLAWLKDTSGHYIAANQAFLKAAGRQRMQDIQGKTDFDIWPKELAEKYRADDAEVMALRQQKNVEEQAVDGDKTYWVETFKTPVIDENNNVLGTAGFARDITERKEHEEELKRSNAELEQFSYAISHDMRQPLRMISSYLQLIEMSLAGQLDGEKRDYFKNAIEGAKRIDQMLIDLLEYSRIGRMGEPLNWIESRAVLDEALQFLQPAIVEAQAKVNIAGEWPRIFVSHNEMLMLLQNLIGNAVKYRAIGQKLEITVSGEIAKNEWRLCVADNGIGIIPDQIKRLFQMFQRLHTRAVYEGTGIGLALCRKITEHHKGRIWAESAGEGQGSRFCVVLPVLREKT